MTSQIAELPDAIASLDAFASRIRGRQVAVFLDYDGTLSPIVADPAAAVLPQRARAALRALARRCPVAVVSGRDLDDVAERVDVDGVAYAGSHGLDIDGPAGRQSYGEEHLGDLDAAEGALAQALEGIPGAGIERKRFTVAVHYRQVASERERDVAEVVDRVARAYPQLRVAGGKRVYELRPAVDWDKGRAVLWLLEALELDRDDVVPIYVGDDLTDEDAFAALAERGYGVVVRGEEDARATAASASLADTDAVIEWLERLDELIDDHG